MRLAIASGTRLGFANVMATQHDNPTVDPELLIGARHPLALANGGAHNVGHDQATLELGDVVALVGGGVRAAHEPAKSGGHGAGLAERGQHVVDVPQERLRRADEQHPAALEEVAVLVEQERRAVQRHGGLAGAGTALDHEGAGHGRTDDRVLLGLDGGDDVAHAARAAGAERGEQRAFALERVPEPGLLERLDVENVVFDRRDDAALGGEVAALDDARGVGGGRGVERASGGGAPVGEQGSVIRIGKADAANVERVARHQVQASEAQPVLDGVELRDAVLVERGERVPL